MNEPCPISSPCQNPANPITNYSSEAPDPPVFIGFGSAAAIDAPNPGDPFTNPFGYFYCSSATSQEAAQLCADNGSTDNGVNSGGTSNDPPPNTADDSGRGGAVFWNDTQSFAVTCPDGGTFSYTIPAMSVRAQSPTYANQIALSLAQIRANRYLICISNASGACLGEEYDQLITASSQTAGGIDWQLRSGVLPPGLQLLPNLFNLYQISIAGTPTVAGNYVFVLRATDSLGNFTDKTFTLAVLGITNSPTQATVGTPYSFQFTAAGGTAPYTFSVPPGHLPAGLSMSASGLITGTPTDTIPTTFTVTIDDNAGNQCGTQFTMTPQAAGCAFEIANLNWTYFNQNDGTPGFVMTAGSGTFTGSPADVNAPTDKNAFCTITNNTAAPFTVRFSVTLNSAMPIGGFNIFDFFIANWIINQAWPFVGPLQADQVINPGESHALQFEAQGGNPGVPSSFSGTVSITCI